MLIILVFFFIEFLCKYKDGYVQFFLYISIQIDFGKRFKGSHPQATSFTSIDGTDCPIHEPTPFDPKWYSHKINGPGVRYEIALCIKSGEIVWAFGGLPCGEYPDLKLARVRFTSELRAGEKAVADRTYRDDTYFINPYNDPESAAIQKDIMARHETVNKRLKQFNALPNFIRHDIVKHKLCFYAVCNITQLMLLNGEPLYEL
jgi:hypothetical protein